MLTQQLEELKEILIRLLGKQFPEIEEEYHTTLEKGMDLFFDFIRTPVDESFAELDSRIISNLHEQYIIGANYTRRIDILKSLTTNIDPFLKKILRLCFEEDYKTIKQKRQGLLDVIVKLPKLIKDYRPAKNHRKSIANVLHGDDPILDTDRGRPKDFVILHKTRNDLAHNAPYYDDNDFASSLTSCIAVYFYSFFEYLEELKPYIKSPSQTTSIEKHHEKAHFFRHLDDWSNFIQNSSIIIDNTSYHGNNITEQLCEKIYHELWEEMVGLGRILLRDRYDEPHITERVFFKKYLETGMPYKEVMKLISHFVNEMAKRDENERWEYQKNYIGSTNHESEQEKYALRALGSTNFYHIPYKDDYEISRQYYYSVVVQKMVRQYGSFLDGYVNAIETSLNFIDQLSEPESYVDDLNARFRTKFDYLLLLYLLLAKHPSPELVSKIKKYINFEEIIDLSTSQKMLDLPSLEQLKKEIEFALEGDFTYN